MGSLEFQPRLLPLALDHEAAHNPDKLFCIHPVSLDSLDAGWRRVTIRDLASAVDNIAWWIHQNIAPDATAETLMYIGCPDIRYAVFTLACMKLRHCTLLIAPDSSLAVIKHLLQAEGVSKVVFTPDFQEKVQQVKQTQPSLQTWEVMGLWEACDTTSKPYTCNFASSSEVEKQHILTVTSSGTTGMPKAIHLSHECFTMYEYLKSLPIPPGKALMRPSLSGQASLQLMRCGFHHLTGVSGWSSAILHPSPFVLPPNLPVTPELLNQIVAQTGANIAHLPANILSALSSSEAGLQSLAQFQAVFFAGTPLVPKAGDKIATVTLLCQGIGSTETGFIPSLRPKEREDWQYFEWNENYPLEMREYDGNSMEMVIRRSSSYYLNNMLDTFAGGGEYHTGDLFTQHPRKPELWKYVGRIDNIFKLPSRLRFNPAPIETTIECHDLVSRALLTTYGSIPVVLIVEPSWDQIESKSQSVDVVDKLWPLLQEINGTLPLEAHILRNRVVVSSPSKPFKTTPKGTVQRRFVLEDYANEIDALVRST